MILAERITDKLRSFYRQQPEFDVGERPRLGIDERRAQTRLRPHSEQLGEISIKRGRDAETPDPCQPQEVSPWVQ